MRSARKYRLNSEYTSTVNGNVEVKSVYFRPKVKPIEKDRYDRFPKQAAKRGFNGMQRKIEKLQDEDREEIPSKLRKRSNTKAKRAPNRFKGVTKDELMKRIVPDIIKNDLDILIIGTNPGLFSAYKVHHYAGPGNHFWKCLFMSGLIPIPLSAMEDGKALDYGIGLTNIVDRPTPSSADLTSKEIREGARKLVKKIQLYKPKIAVFNGKGIYEIFSKEIFGQKKKDIVIGTQENKVPRTETYVYVMPSSSPRCSLYPRAEDKLHFYTELKKLRDEIIGVKSSERTGYSFHSQKLAVCKVDDSLGSHKVTEFAKTQRVKEENNLKNDESLSCSVSST